MADKFSDQKLTASTAGLQPGEVAIFDPETKNVLAVPESDVQSVLSHGGVLATPDQIKNVALENEYGDREKTAAVLGLARSLSFGLSDVAARGLGYEELVREIKERNKLGTGFGEIGGIAVPLLLSGGTIALAKGAQVGGKGVLAAARAGSAVEKRLASALAKTALSEGEKTLGKQIALKAIPRAAGSAVEASFYGAGQRLSETALGDPETNAEKLIAHYGLNSLLGAAEGGLIGLGFGGLTGTTQAISPFLISKGRIGYEELRKKIPFYGEKAIEKKREGIIAKLRPEDQKIAREVFVAAKDDPVQKALLDDALLNTFEREADQNAYYLALKDHISDVNSALRKFNKTRQSEIAKNLKGDVRKLENLSEELGLDGVSLETARGAGAQVLSDFRGFIKGMKSQPEIYKPFYTKKLEIAAKGFKKQLDKQTDAFGVWQLIDQYKDDAVGKLAKFGRNVSPEDEEAISIIKQIRSTFKRNLEDTEIWGEAAARQASINDAYSKFLHLAKPTNAKAPFRKYFMVSEIGRTGEMIAELDPRKVDTWLKSSDKSRQFRRSEVMQDFLEATDSMLDQISKTNVAVLGDDAGVKSLKLAQQRVQALKEETLRRFILGNQLRRLGWDIEHNPFVRAQMSAVKNIGSILPIPGAHTAAQIVANAIDQTKPPIAKFERLARIENMLKTVDDRIANAMDKFLTSKRVSGVPKFVGKLSVPLVTKAGLQEGKTDYDNRINEIMALANDPQKLASQLDLSTSALSQVAPLMATQMSRKLANGVAFLQTKVPQNPFGSLDSDWQPSDFERSTFERYYSGVIEPMTVVEDMEDGILNIEGLEALKAVHPALYNKLSESAFEKISTNEKEIPYDKKIMASMVFEMPFDKTMDPSFISYIQGSYAAKDQLPKTIDHPPRRGVSSKSAEREQSQVSRIQNRR